MRYKKIVFIILIILVIVIVLILSRRDFGVSENNTLTENVDQSELVADFQADLLTLSSKGLYLFDLADKPKLTLVDQNNKKIIDNKDLNLKDIDHDSEVLVSFDGSFLFVFNKMKESFVFDLKNNRKVKTLHPNTKLVSQIEGKEFYYWYQDKENNNIAKTFVDDKKWQLIYNLPSTKAAVSSLNKVGNSLLVTYLDLKDDELTNPVTLSIDLQNNEPTPYPSPQVIQRSTVAGNYLVLEWFDQENKMLSILPTPDWQNWPKAKSFKVDNYLIVQSLDPNSTGVLLDKNQDVVLKFLASDQEMRIKDIFTGRQYSVPDGDYNLDFSNITFSQINKAVILGEDLYLQIGFQVYHSKLNR